MGIIDANVLIRYYTGDNPEKAAQARSLVEQIDNGMEVAINEAVIAEVVHVLSSKRLYGYTRQEIKDYLIAFITLRGVVMPNRAIVVRALILYTTTNLDFVDALLAAYVESGKYEHVISFDEKIANAAGIAVVMP